MHARVVAYPLTVIAALLLVSCAPHRSNDAARIDSLRTQAEDLIKTQARMSWNSWAFGAPSNQDSLYRASASLFTREHIQLVGKTETTEPDAVQKKRLRYLRRYLTTELIAKETAPLSDKVSNVEASATVSVAGVAIPYRQIGRILANEKDHRKRAALYAAVDPVLDSLTTILAQIERITQRLATDLGYPTYNDMLEELKEFPLGQFKQTAEGVLAKTDSVYASLLSEMVKRHLNLDPSQFYRYDTPALFRSQQFDKFFPPGTMIQTLGETYRGLGIDIETQKNLKIDSEPRATKNPRAVCYPIDVPEDIRLSIKPVGGVDDYAALFHEMGHGQHYAHTKENAFEFKYLGEQTVTETFAFLSEYLLSNQAWLRLHTTMPVPALKEFVRFQAFVRLYYIRRYCAKYLYELQLHSGTPNPQVVYAQLLGKTLGYRPLPSDEKRYLVDLDAHYYVASYLRAWFLEAQLNAALTRNFGVNWFEHPQAGGYLQSLWAPGDRLNGEELVHNIGYDRISPDVLLAELTTMILFSTK
jgi:hypothetical protein